MVGKTNQPKTKEQEVNKKWCGMNKNQIYTHREKNTMLILRDMKREESMCQYKITVPEWWKKMNKQEKK